jgi:hypothetical protein
MTLLEAKNILKESIASAPIGNILMGAILSSKSGGGLPFFKMVYEDKECKDIIDNTNKLIKNCLQQTDREYCKKQVAMRKQKLEEIFNKRGWVFSDDVSDIFLPDIEELEDD